MKHIVKGRWENILVATVFVHFTCEEWNMRCNGGEFNLLRTYWRDWQWTCTLSPISKVFPSYWILEKDRKELQYWFERWRKHPEVKKPQGQNVQIIKKSFRESLERAEKYLSRQKIPDAKRAFYLAEDLRPGTFKTETEQIIIKFEDRLIKHKESLLQVFRWGLVPF